MMKEAVEDTPKMVTGKFSIRTYSVEVLFDSGAAHSFISTRLVKTLWVLLKARHSPLSITLPNGPNGKVVDCRDLYIDCSI